MPHALTYILYFIWQHYFKIILKVHKNRNKISWIQDNNIPSFTKIHCMVFHIMEAHFRKKKNAINFQNLGLTFGNGTINRLILLKKHFY